MARVFPWLVLMFMGVALKRTRGHLDEYYFYGIAAVLLAYALLPVSRQKKTEDDTTRSWLGFPLVFFAWNTLYRDILLMYAVPGANLQILYLIVKLYVVGAFAVATTLLKKVARFLMAGSAPVRLMIYVFCLLFLARFLTVQLTPHPLIDVYDVTNLSGDYFLKGLNPYEQQYPDITQGAYGYSVRLTYLPGVVWISALFRLLFSEFRYGLVWVDLALVAVLVLIGRSLRFSARTALVLPLIWLSFPPALFILEQNWIDPLLMLAIAGALLCAIKRWWWFVGVSLGVALSFKQYSGAAVATLILFLFIAEGWKPALKAVGTTVATFGVLVAPFFLWNPSAYLIQTVGYLVNILPRKDALSFSGLWFSKFGHAPPHWILIFPALISLLALYRLIKNPDLVHWARATAVIYASVFLFAKYAFCNYYYFVVFFVFLECCLGLVPLERAIRKISG